MLKFLLVIAAALTSSSAFATNVEIACQRAPYVVTIKNPADQIQPQGSYVFTIYKDLRPVGSGVVELVGQGYEHTLLQAYIWGFQSKNPANVIGVGVPGLRSLIPGTYNGWADLFVSANGHVVDGSTVPCEVTILQ